ALSSQGEAEAKRAGELLMEKNLLPDLLHTSLLTRAIHTAEIALGACERKWIPVSRSWRLNERHYGALQGKDKAATLKEYGEEQFKLWRRSFDTPPPAIADSDQYAQAGDIRYKDLGPDLPKTECLKDVVKRLMPYLDNEIANDLRQAKTVLVVAHGNSIRAIVKHLACISDSDIAEVNIPTGIPLLYRFDDDFEPIIKEGEYLDPEAARESIAAVANQGK
ncbi:MAG: 2,3-bisphosphoglycerate-dependent phosphoglycerate mutase, partial [Actinomycetota bacterium]